MNRIGINEYYMNIAVQTSLRSTCMRRKVGAVIVKDNRILSTGYNGAPSGLPNCIDDCDRCYRSAHNIPSGQQLDMCYAVHAEQNAIMNALMTGENLKGASLYVNTYPCSTCLKLTIQAGIKEVYFINEYENLFTKQMAEEAGVKLVKLDGSIYRTPVGTEVKTVNDLDAIDPLVGLIYKYTPGTKEFEENRFKVLEERNFFNKYNELIYYTTYKMNTEILNVYDVKLEEFEIRIENRCNLEYNGDDRKQLVVGAVVFDVYKQEFYVLKCKGERLANKLTLVQGHMAVPEDTLKGGKIFDMNYIIEYNLLKELEEEVCLNKDNILNIDPLYVIQSNDNKISSEHMGVISIVYIDSSKLEKELVSGEPNKHDVVKLSTYDICNLDIINNMDCWLRKIIMKIKEDLMA